MTETDEERRARGEAIKKRAQEMSEADVTGVFDLLEDHVHRVTGKKNGVTNGTNGHAPPPK